VASLLFGVSPGDPVTLALVAIALLAVAALASLLPARASARVDPAVTLRAE
jgi:putative ABC transport system permease protein